MALDRRTMVPPIGCFYHCLGDCINSVRPMALSIAMDRHVATLYAYIFNPGDTFHLSLPIVLAVKFNDRRANPFHQITIIRRISPATKRLVLIGNRTGLVRIGQE